jgi:hypothetical protein
MKERASGQGAPDAACQVRPDIEEFRQGIVIRGERTPLGPGGILRVEGFDAGTRIKARFIRMLAPDAETAKRNVSLGHASLALFVPEHLRPVHDDVAKSVLAENPRATLLDISKAYVETVKGEPCYRGSHLLFHPDRTFQAGAEDLMDRLVAYYEEDRFRRCVDADGREREPVGPGVIVRALDGSGRIMAALKVAPENLYREGCATPDQRAGYAAEAALGQIGGPGVAGFDCLPYDRRMVSKFSLTSDPEREWTARTVMSFVFARHMSSELVDGRHELRALRCAAGHAGNGMVTEIVVPTGESAIEVARLTREDGLLREAKPAQGKGEACREMPAAMDEDEWESPAS